jgi:accessory gene regulator B
MIDKLGDTIAHWIYRHDQGSNARLDELTYGIAHALNTFIPVVLTLIIASILDRTAETLIGMIAFALFRSLTGGYHFRNPTTCTLATVVILTTLPILKYDQCYFIYNALAILFTTVFSICEKTEHTNLQHKNKSLLTMIAILTVHLNYVIGSDLLSIAFLVQSVTIIHLPGRRKMNA